MTLRDYLSVLQRRMWTVASMCALVAGAALAVSYLQTPVYEARTRLLLGTSQTTVDNGGFAQYIDPNRIQTEIQVLMGKPVVDLVRADLGSAPGITASAVGGTAVIELTARGPKATVAADIANAYASAYITYRQRQFADTVTTLTREYTRQIEALKAQIAAVEVRPRALDGPPSLEADRLRAEQAVLRVKLQQVDSAERLSGSTAAVILPAAPAATPVSPTPLRNALLGTFVGLVLGVGVALLLEHLDDSLKTADGVERIFPQLTVMGVIPLITTWRNSSQTLVVAATDPTSPAAEAYRTLRTSIQVMSLDRSLRVLQVTSPIGSEGKSTTVANLAVTLSQAGLTVIVVCCDLRRPRINAFFDLKGDVGFTSVLLGQSSLIDALQSVPDMPRLRILASGPFLPNPSEVLSSRRTTDLFAELRTQADIVLIDCPPVLPVTDAAVVATKVDGTVVVAWAGSTTYKDLTRTMQLLSHVDAPLLGLVLNRGTMETAYDYRYLQPAPATLRNGQVRKEGRARRAAGTSGNGSRRKVT